MLVLHENVWPLVSYEWFTAILSTKPFLMETCFVYINNNFYFIFLKKLQPAANGHFAVRFPWLDYLPPIHSPLGLSRPCLHITVIPPGNRVPTMSPPVQVTGISVRGHKDDTDGSCSCSFCIQDLLKLQVGYLIFNFILL